MILGSELLNFPIKARIAFAKYDPSKRQLDECKSKSNLIELEEDIKHVESIWFTVKFTNCGALIPGSFERQASFSFQTV